MRNIMGKILTWKSSTIIVIILLTILAACSDTEDGDGISGNFDLSGETVTITTTVYDTQAQVRAACNAIEGSGGAIEQGCAVATYDPTNGHHCEVHVVKIRSVQDSTRINTWGHEYAHCLYGLWHS